MKTLNVKGCTVGPTKLKTSAACSSVLTVEQELFLASQYYRAQILLLITVNSSGLRHTLKAAGIGFFFFFPTALLMMLPYF